MLRITHRWCQFWSYQAALLLFCGPNTRHREGLWRSTAAQLLSPLAEGEVRKAKKLSPKDHSRGHGQEQKLAGPCAPWSWDCPSYLLLGGCFWEAEAKVFPNFQACKTGIALLCIALLLCFIGHITCLANSCSSCRSLNHTVTILIPSAWTTPTVTILLSRWTLMTTSLQLEVVGWLWALTFQNYKLTWCPVFMVKLWKILEDDHRIHVSAPSLTT